MRSTSRWKHVRISHGGSGAGRPVDCVLSRPCGPMNSASAASRFSLGQGTGIPPFPQKIDVCGRSALRHFRLQYSYTTLLCISLFFLKNAEKKVLKSIDNFLTGVWPRFSAHFLRILGMDIYASSRMFMRFFKKRNGGGTHREARSDADAGIHRLRKGRRHGAEHRAGGGADTGCGTRMSVSIPQSALRLPAPFAQGSRGCGTDTRCDTGAAGGSRSLSISSGERSSPPSRQGEGIALRRCRM